MTITRLIFAIDAMLLECTALKRIIVLSKLYRVRVRVMVIV